MLGASNGSPELLQTGSPHVSNQRRLPELGHIHWHVPWTHLSSEQVLGSAHAGHAPTWGQSASAWHAPIPPLPAPLLSSGHLNSQRPATHTGSPHPPFAHVRQSAGIWGGQLEAPPPPPPPRPPLPPPPPPARPPRPAGDPAAAADPARTDLTPPSESSSARLPGLGSRPTRLGDSELASCASPGQPIELSRIAPAQAIQANCVISSPSARGNTSAPSCARGPPAPAIKQAAYQHAREMH